MSTEHIKKFRTAQRVQSLEYAIRDVVAEASRLERSGKEVIYLNIGDPVRFDFPTPKHIQAAMAAAVSHGFNNYSPSEGFPELRDEISIKQRREYGIDIDPSDIIVTSGVSEAIQFLMAAALEPGDEILVSDPSYPTYVSYAKLFGGVPVAFATKEENGWQPNLEDLASKISKRTRLIVIVNPSNPTGSVYGEKTLRRIIEIAAHHELPVVSDEIYEKITFEEKFRAAASLAGDVAVVTLGGFSKAYLMTGWRLGYISFHDEGGKVEDLKDAVKKQARLRICANAPAQKAAVEALRGPQNHIGEMVDKLKVRRDLVVKRLNEIRGIECTKPDAAFYAFPNIAKAGRWTDDRSFVMDLLHETGVLVVHGSGFGSSKAANHFRMTFLPPPAALENALDRLERFLRKESGPRA